MSIIAGLLTFFLILNCLVLILLVLIQLPKKDAGAGLAFGGGAADTLFGSGSGNVLTKVTKYAAGVFLVLALILSFLGDKLHRDSLSTSTDFIKQVEQKQLQTTITAPAPKTAPKPANNLLTIPATAPATPPTAPATPAAVPATPAANLPPATK